MENNNVMPEPEIIPPGASLPRKSKDAAPSVSAAAGGVAVGADNIKIGAGDIKNDKSVGEGMQVKDGEVNITVNNNNSKTVTKSAANRFAKLPDAPVAKAIDDKSMEM